MREWKDPFADGRLGVVHAVGRAALDQLRGNQAGELVGDGGDPVGVPVRVTLLFSAVDVEVHAVARVSHRVGMVGIRSRGLRLDEHQIHLLGPRSGFLISLLHRHTLNDTGVVHRVAAVRGNIVGALRNLDLGAGDIAAGPRTKVLVVADVLHAVRDGLVEILLGGVVASEVVAFVATRSGNMSLVAVSTNA